MWSQYRDKIAEIRVIIPVTNFVKQSSKSFEESFDVAMDSVINQIKRKRNAWRQKSIKKSTHESSVYGDFLRSMPVKKYLQNFEIKQFLPLPSQNGRFALP